MKINYTRNGVRSATSIHEELFIAYKLTMDEGNITDEALHQIAYDNVRNMFSVCQPFPSQTIKGCVEEWMLQKIVVCMSNLNVIVNGGQL